MSIVPVASSLSASPLRNRIRIHLTAPLQEVAALVADHTKLPEYSAGITRVEMADVDEHSEPMRVCYFRPTDAATDGMVLREVVRWSAPDVGYATSAEPDNPFGLREDLSIVTVEPFDGGTVFTWSQYYDADDLEAMRASFEEGLTDIADHLIARFGGAMLDRYVDR